MVSEDNGGPPPGVPVIITLNCGARGRWNYDAGYGYICMDCFCVVGSVSQPKECQDAKH